MLGVRLRANSRSSQSSTCQVETLCQTGCQPAPTSARAPPWTASTDTQQGSMRASETDNTHIYRTNSSVVIALLSTQIPQHKDVKSDILYKLIKLPLILSQFVNQKPTVISIVLSYFHVYESADSSSDGSLSCSFSSSPTKNHNAAVHAGVCKRLYCPERFQQLCLQRSLLEKCDESILIRERRRPGQ